MATPSKSKTIKSVRKELRIEFIHYLRKLGFLGKENKSMMGFSFGLMENKLRGWKAGIFFKLPQRRRQV